MKRAFNFCAGPAALPLAVLERAKNELLDWQGRGVSVMEISHRSGDYVALAQQAESNLRRLLAIPDSYAVLFLQGGATLQFAGTALNLLHTRADYIITGLWSAKAYDAALRYQKAGLGQINLLATNQDSHHTRLPNFIAKQEYSKADYVHYCSNETVHGVQMLAPPQVDAPLVVDMSSDILSRPLKVSDYGLIYAGGQKNMGTTGLTVVIVCRDLLGEASLFCPNTLNYQLQANAQSMLNTPSTYSWYLAGLVFEWLLEQGGTEAMAVINEQKSTLLYRVIDESDFYGNAVAKNCRSQMNVPFVLADKRLETVFLQQAKEAGLLNLQGHRAVGGLRASLYNAVGLDAVQALVDFMIAFERRWG